MKSQFHFDDHAGFQLTVRYLTNAGAIAGILGAFCISFFSLSDSASMLTLFALIGAFIGGASGCVNGRWTDITLRFSLGGALGLLFAYTLIELTTWTFVAASLTGGILGGSWVDSRAPFAARFVGTAILALIGVFVCNVLFIGEGAPLGFDGVSEVATGSVLGLFLSLGAAVGRFRIDDDPVIALWHTSQQRVRGDMFDLTERGISLYREIISRIADRSSRLESQDRGYELDFLGDTRRVAADTTERLIRLAVRWCEIESSLDDSSRGQMVARLAALKEKVRTVEDSVVLAEYSAAAESVKAQLEGFDRIDLARERLVARMHRCLTSLEQVSFILLQLSTSDAQQASLSLQPVLARLDEMTEEFSWKSLSVDDLVAIGGFEETELDVGVKIDPGTEPESVEVALNPTADEDEAVLEVEEVESLDVDCVSPSGQSFQ